ncbi:MAG TPA: DnaB-like helicase C-terminal domain-containing protein [Dermatophilaceae bacterium]|jgi:replicative DNA helicase
MRTDRLKTLHTVLEETEGRLQVEESAGAAVWPSGFGALDAALTGGFRSGELALLGARPGLGKTTFALQVARNLVAANYSVVYFSFEHDNHNLLERLIIMEAAEIAGSLAVRLPAVRRAFEAPQSSDRMMEGRLAGTEGGVEAIQALQKYCERLHLHRSSGAETNVEAMRVVIENIRERTGMTPFVVVDYLQKVHAAAPSPDGRQSDHLSEDDRITEVVEGLKDMALDLTVPVLALVAVDKSGLAAATRTRTQDLRGSSALAHEADIVLILNNKFDVVARHHLMYNSANAEQFHHWVVLSIEKNRNGVDNVDLEFHKRFEHSRFDTDGGRVEEELIDDRIFVD